MERATTGDAATGSEHASRRIGLAIFMAGTAALASGAALLVFLLTRLSLQLALVGTVAVAASAVVLAVRFMPPPARRRLGRTAVAGAVAGGLATVVYDVSRWGLVASLGLDANPWEALPEFGRLLVGVSASTAAVWTAGMAFHLANGIGFAVAYAVVVRRAGILTGVLWALALEALMLTFYPGWLDIRARQEFLSISMLGHLGYGASLGVLVARLRPVAAP